MNSIHPDPRPPSDALLTLSSLFGIDAKTDTISIPIRTVSIDASPVVSEPSAPQPLRAGSIPRMPHNWALPPLAEPSQPAYLRGATDADAPLPSRRSLREAGEWGSSRRSLRDAAESGSSRPQRTSRGGRRAAVTVEQPDGLLADAQPRTRRMLWVASAVGVAASAVLVGALAMPDAPAEAPSAALSMEQSPTIPDDALSRDVPPDILGPTPLFPNDADTEAEPEPQPDSDVQPRQPVIPARPPAGVTTPKPSPSPTPTPTPSPSPTPTPTPTPTPEPEPEPAPPADPAP